MHILGGILATIGLVALNGFFVAAEFAAVGARKSLLSTTQRPGLFPRLALAIKTNLYLYLSACQLGITIASLALGAVLEPFVAELLRHPLDWLGVPATHSHGVSLTIALVLATSLHVVVGEQAPKNWAIVTADRMLPIVALPLILFTYLFYPFIWCLNALSKLTLATTGVKLAAEAHGLPHTADELRTLLEDSIERGAIKKSRGNVLSRAFEFEGLKVRQIMTPRTSVDYLVLGQPIRDVLRTVQASAFTRLPLCDGDLDHVIGLVHMKDLFNHLKLIPGRLRFADQSTPDGEAVAIADGLPGSSVHVIGSGDIDLREIRRDVLFVPELLPVPKLLAQFQASRTHMAVVVDEYGTTQGIVTLEDVLEEIVGEIEDEFDTASPPTFAAEGENYRVSGLYALHDLREQLSLAAMEDNGVDTLGGYITARLGRLPKPGDTVPLEPYIARVITVNQNRVGQVLIMPATQNAARADGPGKT